MAKNRNNIHEMQDSRIHWFLAEDKAYLDSSSQGLMPVCFLKAVEKWEMEEYPK